MKKILFANVQQVVIGIILLLLTSVSFAVEKKQPLPADQAFQVHLVKQNDNHQAALKFTIVPGYYIYRDRVQIHIAPQQTKLHIALPKGQNKQDSNGRLVQVFKNKLIIPLPAAINQAENLVVDFQGCSAQGFCYPPMHQSFALKIAQQQPVVTTTTTTTTVSTAAPSLSPSSPPPIKSLLTDQHGIEKVLYSQNYGLIMLLFIGLGLLLAFTPCVLPMVPILTGIIIGQKEMSTRKAFLLSLTYVLGTAITYAFAGMVAALMGNSLQVWLQKPVIIIFVSLLFFLLALSLFGLFELRLPGRMQTRMVNFSNTMTGGTFAGVFGMGVLSTLIVSPCVTAPLVGVLLYIGQTGNMLLGGSALFALGIGMGIPLLLIGTTAGKWLPKAGAWMEVIKKLFGIVMLMMAVWLISRILSPQMADIIWKLCLLSLAFVVGGYIPRLFGYQNFHHVNAILASVCGILLLAFVFNVPNPMAVHGIAKQEVKPTFRVVHNLTDLDMQLKLAQSLNKPVILDFYADWCDSCIAMDKNVFAKRRVKEQLSHYILLRADLTANNAEDEALLQHFSVIAPPTILFFDNKGHELDNQRIVGEIDAKEFLARLEMM